ncbi:MAG: phosphate-selective porin OprO and OprP [Aliidongia sp.]|jgi:phosphate-selective porin OprO/OprP|nr:phosphate-selective porin OprO and OprP [Aliidongia sp.]
MYPIDSKGVRRRWWKAGVSMLAVMAPAPAAAQNTDLAALLNAQQEQIRQLQQQLQSLQEQIRAEQAQRIAAATPPASAAAAPVTAAVADDAPKVVKTPNNRFFLSSADGENTVGLTGRLHLDAGDYVDVRPASKATGPGDLSSGFNARRARIGVTGKVAGNFNYAFIYDAGNSQDNTPRGIQTAQIAYSGLPNTAIEFGYSDTFFSLDEATSSNDVMFLERATPSVVATGIAAGDFRSNAGVRNWSDRYWIGAYATGPGQGQAHNLTAEQFGAYQRATYQIFQGADYSVHLGVGASELLKAPNTGPGTANALTLSDAPELRIDNTALLSTGALGTIANPVTGAKIYNLETAAGFRSLFFQGEYFHYDIDRRGLAAASFDGGYGEASWTVTGESRKYNPATGSYSGIVPDHPFSISRGGWGAWEIAARISTVSLVDNFIAGKSLASQPSAVDGGRQTNFTLGLNWYVNSNMRYMLDWVHGGFDRANPTAVPGAPLGSQIGTDFDAIAIRAQVAF